MPFNQSLPRNISQRSFSVPFGENIADIFFYIKAYQPLRGTKINHYFKKVFWETYNKNFFVTHCQYHRRRDHFLLVIIEKFYDFDMSH